MCVRAVHIRFQVVVRPGESTLAFYTAHNLSNEPIVGVSTYNVTPPRAGLYFMKIQCFCFEEQRLLPGEKIDMPIFFYLVGPRPAITIIFWFQCRFAVDKG